MGGKEEGEGRRGSGRKRGAGAKHSGFNALIFVARKKHFKQRLKCPGLPFSYKA